MNRIKKRPKPTPLRPLPAMNTAELRVASFIASDLEDDHFAFGQKLALLKAALRTAQKEGK